MNRIAVGLRPTEVESIRRILPNAKVKNATLIMDGLSVSETERALAILEEYAKGLSNFRWVNISQELEIEKR